MRPLKITTAFVSAFIMTICSSAIAQKDTIEKSEIETILLEIEPQKKSAVPFEGVSAAAILGLQEQKVYNPDESADSLNAQQQIKQTFTLRRTINGKVVETQKQTVTYNPRMPYKETEAGLTTVERLISTFDGEVLTRNEAFEEAKLDFTIADVNRNNHMSVEEFSELVVSWKDAGIHTIPTPNEESKRQRGYDAFLAEISPETANQQLKANARKKFLFLTGGVEEVSRKDYIREYLLDFDSMDADNDLTLKGNELERFRALNSGETTEIPPVAHPLN